jgi:cyclic beta-1,2-glucan synthetase
VERGYGILQPNICISEQSTEKWGIAKTLVGKTCHPETPPLDSSNIHFDLFGSSGFFGKGIYDVNSFAQLCDNRVPLEQILSHDIFEAGLVRTGYAGDVTFVEPCPRTYKLFYERQHRWTRGDWQNLFFIMGLMRGRGIAGDQIRLSGFTRYLALSFVRRSLLPIARAGLLLAIVCGDGDYFMPRFLTYWFLETWPEYCHLALSAMQLAFKAQLFHRRREFLKALQVIHAKELTFIVCAFHQALVMSDAILRAIYRSCVNKLLLSWEASSYVETKLGKFNLTDFYAALASLSSFAILIFVWVSNRPNIAIILAATFSYFAIFYSRFRT